MILISLKTLTHEVSVPLSKHSWRHHRHQQRDSSTQCKARKNDTKSGAKSAKREDLLLQTKD
jgi:NADH:ubiquinone oxidoreductase subunit